MWPHGVGGFRFRRRRIYYPNLLPNETILAGRDVHRIVTMGYPGTPRGSRRKRGDRHRRRMAGTPGETCPSMLHPLRRPGVTGAQTLR